MWKKPKQKKAKPATKQSRFQKHFRKVRSGKFTGHPGYIFDESNDSFAFIGLTKSPATHGKANIPLEHNPEPGKTEPSFLRPQTDTEKKGAFSPRLKGWKLSAVDKQKAAKIMHIKNKREK